MIKSYLDSDIVQFRKMYKEYTDLLIDDFVKILEYQIFEDKNLISSINGLSVDEVIQLGFAKEKEIRRLLEALLSVNALRIVDGKIEKGDYTSHLHPEFIDSLKVLPTQGKIGESLEMMKSLLDQKYIKSQVDSCLSCDELLKNSITYDLLVVRKFMQADVTYNALISGMSQVSEVFELESKQIFDHYLTHPELLRVYGLGFASSHVFSDMEFVSKLSFSGPERILDLGGGCANLGNIILSTQDTVYYTNYDLPGVADAFSSEINQLKENFQNRFQLIEGDMFHQEENLQGIQNEKYDKIFLGWILHDWSDEQCLKILKKCRGHLAPEGEIIIFEILPIEGNHFSFIDWLIFVMANGYERNFEAYKRLAEKACMEIESVYSTKSNRSMIKVRKIK